MPVTLEHKRELKRQQGARCRARAAEARQQYRESVETSPGLRFGFGAMAVFDKWHREAKTGIAWADSQACRDAAEFAADVASGAYD